jgi:hypothetical protein
LPQEQAIELNGTQESPKVPDDIPLSSNGESEEKIPPHRGTWKITAEIFEFDQKLVEFCPKICKVGLEAGNSQAILRVFL